MALEVLVVDDEADIRDLVSGVLEDEGYAVRTAADSTAALDAIAGKVVFAPAPPSLNRFDRILHDIA